MSMTLDEKNGLMRFDIPNSEASINAQHCGIKDRSVGSYYLSERLKDCLLFLSDLQGDYYIDTSICYLNGLKMVNRLKELRYDAAFKARLSPQQSALTALKWLIGKGDYLHKIPNPEINDQGKYLKLDNNDQVISLIKTLMLGDLTSLFIKKIGQDGYVIYFDEIAEYESFVTGNRIINWME